MLTTRVDLHDVTRVERLALMLIVLLGIVSSASAQSVGVPDIDTPGLAIEATVGFGGQTDRRLPLPLSFAFRNDTGRNVEAVLRLHERSTQREAILGDVFLGPESSRHLTAIRSLADWDECIATLHHGGRILWRRELNLNPSRMIDANANLVVFVDEAGRYLNLAGAPAASNTTNTERLSVAAQTGRPVDSVSIKPWQLPNHPGPLFMAQAMIILERTVERNVNRVQWQAVSRWICQGGVVFVHRESREIIDRLPELAPFSADPPITESSFQVRRLGLGAIYEYDSGILSADNQAVRQSIANVVALLNREQINSFVDAADVHERPGGEAERNRYWMLGLFGLYTLFSGGGTLFLFRLNQRQIVIYVTLVVGVTSLLAGLLGGYLRSSRGDLRWLTITQPGAGGLVQVGCVEVQSAGSLNTHVAIQGPNPDLQYIGKREQNYFWQPAGHGYSPFTWQPDRETSDPEICQIEVPMSPWGRRRCHATAYRADAQPLDVKVEYAPTPRPAGDNQTAIPPAGHFSIKIRNPMPFDLIDCWLVVGTSQPVPAGFNSQNQGPYYRGAQVGSIAADGMVDVYHRQQFAQLVSGRTVDFQFDSQFLILQNSWDMYQVWPSGLRYRDGNLIRLSRMGVARAWIIGRINKSTAMTIDESRSDFVPHEGTHIFIQEIPPEELPASLNAPGG